jgi:hypothetical protein
MLDLVVRAFIIFLLDNGVDNQLNFQKKKTCHT